MLGRLVLDQLGVEGEITQEEGFGFLDMKTRFNESKITKQAKAKILCNLKDIEDISGKSVKGYEIHNGISKLGKKCIPFISDSEGHVIGVCNEEKNVAGTYLHGIFDSEEFIKIFITNLKKNNNISINEELLIERINDYKDKEYARLAHVFRENIDMEKIRKIIEV